LEPRDIEVVPIRCHHPRVLGPIVEFDIDRRGLRRLGFELRQMSSDRLYCPRAPLALEFDGLLGQIPCVVNLALGLAQRANFCNHGCRRALRRVRIKE
jgi:hypothetical protein